MIAWPMPATGPVKLHVGCGPRILRGFVNIDLTFEPYANYLQSYGAAYAPDVRGDRSEFVAFDVRAGAFPLSDESVDLVFDEDFIEHIDQRSQILFLAETWRVLKRGAVHRVNTPDLLASMRVHSTFARGSAGVYVQEWDQHQHVAVLTPSLLAEYAYMVGYREVIFTAKNQSTSPLVPTEYRPDASRGVDGNLFADLIK